MDSFDMLCPSDVANMRFAGGVTVSGRLLAYTALGLRTFEVSPVLIAKVSPFRASLAHFGRRQAATRQLLAFADDFVRILLGSCRGRFAWFGSTGLRTEGRKRQKDEGQLGRIHQDGLSLPILGRKRRMVKRAR
jgi:hypothetical protein